MGEDLLHHHLVAEVSHKVHLHPKVVDLLWHQVVLEEHLQHLRAVDLPYYLQAEDLQLVEDNL